MHLVGIDDREAHGCLAGKGGADADLHGLAGIDQAFADRVAEHGAVIDAAAIIGFDIAMGIEMDERQGAVLLGMGLEQRIGHVVIAAERDHLGAAS